MVQVDGDWEVVWWKVVLWCEVVFWELEPPALKGSDACYVDISFLLFQLGKNAGHTVR